MMLGWGLRQSCGSLGRRGAYLLASCAAVFAQPAWAQSASQVLPPTREEVTRQPESLPPQPPPRLELEGGIERTPCALDTPQYSSIHFTFRTAQFEGLEGLSSHQLASAYAPFVGRDVPISAVCVIRDRASAILRAAGYVSAVQVPEQKIGDGTVRYQVIMAHLTQVRVRGDASGAERIIAGYLNRLTRARVFNRNEAERYLLLASDLPGYTVRMTLRPAGTAPGDVVGDVTVQRTAAYSDFNLQNGGSHALGPWGGLLRGQIFGLTGLADRTTLSIFSTSDFSEQQTLQVAHDFRLGPEGVSLSEAFTYGWARPTVPDARVLARTLLNTVELGYPIVRTRSETIRGSVGMDVINQDIRLDRAAFSRDRLRVAFLRLGADAAATDFADVRYSAAEPPWRLSTLLELRQGMAGLGATDCSGGRCAGAGNIPTSRLQGRPNATVLRYTASGEYRPMPEVTFALAARAQYASRPLLSFEQFAAGNYTAGRGYDPGALLGDLGFGTQAEVRLGSPYPASAKKAGVEGYGFWDHSVVRSRTAVPLVAGLQHLNSIGAGARIGFDRFTLDAALALPLTRIGVPAKRPDPRFLVSLTTRLWPWSYR